VAGSRILAATGVKSDQETLAVAKPGKLVVAAAVRMRRAYFDCKFGQLHVRTAFPTTGGFDEQVTLICLHSAEATSRTFNRIMSDLADVRSVYAPDLPGCGESDASPTHSSAEAAAAVSDLANDLRLRQIDLLGVQSGAEVAMHVATLRPELVRRVVFVGVSKPDIRVKQPHCWMDVSAFGADPFETASPSLAKQIHGFLRGT
jgi:pimeloyl-ACP methyl ester carboxylesterase